jgi:hypothetical protein
MYSPLYIPVIQAQQEEIAARARNHRQVWDVRAGVPSGSARNRRRAGKAIAALAVCVATTGVVATSNAGARASDRSHVSAGQLQREIKALNSAGFVATSCEVDGTEMTNYATNQSLLLTW